MKIVICNVPLRSEKLKTAHPPLGALAIIQSLRSAGYAADFYDINFFRPSDEEIEDYFSKNRFDIVGISATVSTSYRIVKRLASIIKSALPKTVTIVGGALTASSEVILKYAHVDFCVVGEGERVIVNLADYIASHGPQKIDEELRRIKGVCFLNRQGDTVFTGYEKQLSVDEIRDADYGIIEKYSRVGHYIADPFIYEQFKYDKRSFETKRRNKKVATIVTSRGCVNRCSFCYRWQSGIRIFSVDRVINYIKNLTERYDVGFISFGDEDFGAAKKWLDEFIEKIGLLNILYNVSGICCDNVDLALLKRLKESGCVAVQYGFESGSNRILKVMEKRANAELNVRIAIETHKAGLETVPALVVGMPGESYQTIRETTEFVNRITEFLPREPVISINALVVLPGTPVYEYARYRGLLGRTLQDEEKYLLSISDKGGISMKQLNLTDYPYFIVLGWIRSIYIAMRYNYYKENRHSKDAASPAKILWSHPLIYRLRYIISPLLIMYKSYKEDKMLFLQRCFELAVWPFKKKTFTSYVSLRSFLKEKAPAKEKEDLPNIHILRLGR